MEGIHRNGRSLTKLLEDTLDLAKIEAGRIEVEPGIFDPRALLNDVIGIYSEEAKKKGIHVECSMNGEVPSAVVSDPVRLRQILINLIGNAVKFTSQGSVHIEVLYRTQQEPNSGQIEFRIKDTGIGLNSDQCANIFEPFVQADSATRRRFGGSGLGLFISRQLARALEGDIQLIETKVGRGTVFLLTLNDLSWKLALSPRSVLTPPDQMIQDREQKTLDGARVLVVEDTADIRNLLKAYLMGLGARVHAVSDGIEGVKAAEEAPFDVILMDIQMPVLDGCGAVERIRGMGVKTPIVAVTARAYADEKTRCLELGFDAYLTKPVLFAELESTLRRLIRLKESRAVPPKSS